MYYASVEKNNTVGFTFQMPFPWIETEGRPDQTLDGAAQAALAAAARAYRAALLQQERMRAGAARIDAERDIEQVGRLHCDS